MNPESFYNGAPLCLLVDGHNMLFRYFRGMPNVITSLQGAPIQGAYGFLASLIRDLRRFIPAKVIVCFDSFGRPDRTKDDPNYKKDRVWDFASEEDNPFSQLPIIEEALRHIHIPTMSVEGVEADDLLATCARKAKSEGLFVIISSNDRDLFQLADAQTTIYYRRGKREYFIDEAEINLRYGIPPNCLSEWTALVGDRSDNISGVKGIGRLGATNLLKRYGTLDGIYDHLDEIGVQHASNLLAAKEQVFRSAALIRLREVALDDRFWRSTEQAPTIDLHVRHVLHAIGVL
jgi:DNA polymerase I